MSNEQGKPLPPKPGMDSFPQDPRKTDRHFVPQKDLRVPGAPDPIATQFPLHARRETEKDARVREVQRQRAVDLFRRQWPGCALPEDLREGGQS